MKIIRPESENDKKNFPDRKLALKGILLLLLIFSLLFYKDTMRNIWEGIRAVTWTELCISILLSALGYLLEGMTIFCMMNAVIPHAQIRDGIFIAFVCEFYRLTTLGNGSGIAEIHYLRQKSIEPGSAAVLTMTQYMMKRIAIMVPGILSCLLLLHSKNTGMLCRNYAVFVGAGCFITIIIIILFLCLVLSSKVTLAVLWAIDWLCRKMPRQNKAFQNWKGQVILLNQWGKEILGQKGRMLCVILIQIIKQTVFYSIPAYLLYGRTNLPLYEHILLMAVSFMLAGIIPAPSGAGSLEFVFLLFFTHFTDSGTALPAILLFRFATWICPSLAGALLLSIHKYIQRRPG